MSVTNRLDLLATTIVLEAWTHPETEDGAPSLPERASLYTAAWTVTRRFAGSLSRVAHEALLTRYRSWRTAYAATVVDLAHPWSAHAVLCGDLLASLDEHLEATRAGQQARRAKGKPVTSEAALRLRELEALGDALASYDSALHRAMGHERASREATYWGDQLHKRTRGAA